MREIEGLESFDHEFDGAMRPERRKHDLVVDFIILVFDFRQGFKVDSFEYLLGIEAGGFGDADREFLLLQALQSPVNELRAQAPFASRRVSRQNEQFGVFVHAELIEDFHRTHEVLKKVQNRAEFLRHDAPSAVFKRDSQLTSVAKTTLGQAKVVRTSKVVLLTHGWHY